MNLKTAILLLGLLGAMPSRLSAEKIDMTPEENAALATHIIVGEVTQIFERMEKTKDWETTYYIAEVRPSKVEKGEGMKKDELVYVRYWRRKWIGGENSNANTNGHSGLPSKGQSLRIYLARNAYDGFSSGGPFRVTGPNNDGGLNVIGGNGFEKLKD